MFKKATRKQAKLRLMINAPSGSGKTYSALLLAQGIGGRVALLDTENDSASLYANEFEFDTVSLKPPYTPERFVEIIKAAEAEGYDILVIDSASHEWTGSGGCLDINEHYAATKFRGNTWSAWSETTPRHRLFIDAILQSSMHIIVTTRAKTETTQGENKKILKLGLKPEQRDGFEYEFTVALDIVHSNHVAVPTKDRTQLFPKDGAIITEQTGEMLLNWLNGGQSPKALVEEELVGLIADISRAKSREEMSEPYKQALKIAQPYEDLVAQLKELTISRGKEIESAAKQTTGNGYELNPGFVAQA